MLPLPLSRPPLPQDYDRPDEFHADMRTWQRMLPRSFRKTETLKALVRMEESRRAGNQA